MVNAGKRFRILNDALDWAKDNPGKNCGIVTPDGIYTITFRSNRALAECNCATAANPPYDCPVHGVLR